MECRPTRHPLTVTDRSVAHRPPGHWLTSSATRSRGMGDAPTGTGVQRNSLCASRTTASRGVQRIGSTGSRVRSSTPGWRYEPQVSAGKRQEAKAT